MSRAAAESGKHAKPAYRRTVLMALAALLLVVLIAYAALPVLLAGIAGRFLAAQGFSNVRVEFGYPGLHRVRAHTVALDGTRAAHAFSFGARDIEIDYDIAELLDGRLIAVRVAEATLRLQPAPASGEAPQPIRVPLPGDWVAALPLRELVVERLHIDWRGADTETFTGSVRGQVKRQDSRLLARLSLADDKRALFEASLVLTGAGELSATLHRAGAPAPPVLRATAMLTPRDDRTLRVRASLDAQLKPLFALLSPWLAVPPPLGPVSGRLQARCSAELPAVLAAPDPGAVQLPKANGTVSLDLSAVQLGKRLSDGSLHLDATLASGDGSIRWRIADSLRISGRIDPAILAVTRGTLDERVARNREPAVVRAPRALSGVLEVAPAQTRLTIAPDAELLLENLWAPDAHIAVLRAMLTEAARITYDPKRGRLATAGAALSLTAPAIEPMFASIGTVEDLAVSVRIAPGPFAPLPPITIEEASVTLLGGRLRARGVDYDVKRETNRLAIELENFDLGRIVALERQFGVEASGALDGRLPLSLSPRGVTIAGGQLRARPPGGVVRYTPNEAARAMAASNPSVKLVQDALSNYHYTKLEADVDYAQTGDLTLRVAMAGHNPDWNAGQPIHLNVNLTDNIPMLLRSLRLADDISEQVEKRVLERSRRRH